MICFIYLRLAYIRNEMEDLCFAWSKVKLPNGPPVPALSTQAVNSLKTTLAQKYGACGYDDVIFFSTDDAIEARAAAAKEAPGCSQSFALDPLWPLACSSWCDSRHRFLEVQCSVVWSDLMYFNIV